MSVDSIRGGGGTMRTIKGPAIYLSQFIGDQPPFNTLDALAGWAASLGYKGVQIPVHDARILDLRRVAEDPAHAASVRRMVEAHGLTITELAAQRAGHLAATHPAYDAMADAIAPPEVRGDRRARRDWAAAQLRLAAQAARNLGVARVTTFSGGLLWPYFYPYPAPPDGMVEAAFDALAQVWRPILAAYEAAEVDLCFELHPGEDLHDGATFARFLRCVDGHRRARILFDPSHMLLQHMDYLGFLDRWHDRIAAFHVKDAEFIPSPDSGVYGGYQDWLHRPGRFRSVGDGQVDFPGIFSRLAQHGYEGWAVLEWECCLKRPEDGAREGARFIADHIIRVTGRSFDAGTRPALAREEIERMIGVAP